MNNELYHHGILGMRWGVRRYQNEDGTLTAKGKARYAKVESSKLLQKSDHRHHLILYKIRRLINNEFY